MAKETSPITDRQEKLLKTVIVKNLTTKLEKHLNDKEVIKAFPSVSEMAEDIVTEFKETNLVDIAFGTIIEEGEKESNNPK